MKKPYPFKTRIFSFCLSLLLFAACTEMPEADGPDESRMIAFDARIRAVTRSSIDWTDFKCEFEPDEAIGIFAAPHGSQLAASGNYANNVKLIKGSAGSWSYADPEQAIFFPAEGVTLDIYAYYPYSESQPDPLAIPFDSGTDQREGAAKSDLMRASVLDVAESDHSISLRFEHLFSMIQLDVSPAADSTEDPADLVSLEVKLNALKTAGTLNLEAGTVVLTEPAGRIAMERKGDTEQFRALIPVQPVTAGAILFSCTVGRKNSSGGTDYTQYNYEAAPNTVLESGKVRLYDLKLP